MRACTASVVIAILACTPSGAESGGQEPDVATIRAGIDAMIQHGVDATRRQDIDAYMEGLPEDLAIHDESGEVISREQQRANVLRDWSVIPATLAIQYTIDSLTGATDSSATVYTSQRWERLMKQRTGTKLDTVLTTQRHRELWRRNPAGWRLYEVVELGGQVWVNGEPWKP